MMIMIIILACYLGRKRKKPWVDAGLAAVARRVYHRVYHVTNAQSVCVCVCVCVARPESDNFPDLPD